MWVDETVTRRKCRNPNCRAGILWLDQPNGDVVFKPCFECNSGRAKAAKEAKEQNKPHERGGEE